VAWPRDVSLKALTKVHLVKVESRRCAIEADFLARLLLEVLGSCLLVPFTLSAGRVAQARDLVFNSNVRLVVYHSPIAKCLAHELLAGASFRGQQTNIWILARVNKIEPVGCRCKNTVWHFMFNVLAGTDPCLRLLPYRNQVAGIIC
jgi:hypothetical protein